jgi:outer membrane protein
MLAVIGAYADVLRDQQALAVRQEHLQMLLQQQDVARARRNAGEATITDVAQADAQLAGVRSLVADAQAELQVSRAEYATLVGQNPGDLAPEPPLPGLPASVEAAFALGETANPDLQQAVRTEEISRARVVEARAAYRPSVSVSAGAGYAATEQPFFGRSNDWNVSAVATVNAPIFQNGLRESGVREALEQNASDRLAVEIARRTMVQNIANAWNRMITARADAALQQEQVRAATVAYKGMQIEYNGGERTLQDVLFAEEALRNAEVALLTAQHEEYVGGASVLRFVGRLRGQDLVTDLPQYDPARHFRQVRDAGMVPWTGLVVGVDAIALPAPRVHPTPAPPGAANPALKPSTAEPPADAPLATALPMAPTPDTAPARPPPRAP